MTGKTTHHTLHLVREPASIIPFPLVKRRDLLARTAQDMISRGYYLGSKDPEATGEKVLKNALRAQRRTMERRGIEADAIERELRCFETAVRLIAAGLSGAGGGDWIA